MRRGVKGVAPDTHSTMTIAFAPLPTAATGLDVPARTRASTAADTIDDAVRLLQARLEPDRPLDTAEQRAVVLIHRGYSEMMLAVARRTLRDPDDAADVVQDVFADLPSLLARYRHCGLGGWLRRVVVNRALMKLRRRRLHEAVLAGSPPWNDEEAAADDRDEAVRARLMALPMAAREVVVLRFFLEMSHAQVAESLGMTIAASEVRLCRALQQMRRELCSRHPLGTADDTQPDRCAS
jgi:RNA polymerase sigma factor (sigma-70 family)